MLTMSLILVIIVGFSLCATEYFVRYRAATRTQRDFRLVATNEPSDSSQELLPGRFTPELQRLTLAVIGSTVFMFIRYTQLYVLSDIEQRLISIHLVPSTVSSNYQEDGTDPL